MFHKCCSKPWENWHILFCQLCKPVRCLRSGLHTPGDNGLHSVFCIVLSRSINLAKVRDLFMLANNNDSHVLVDSTTVNVRNPSRQKKILRFFFFSISTWQFFFVESSISQSGGMFSALRFFRKFNSFSQLIDCFRGGLNFKTKN